MEKEERDFSFVSFFAAYGKIKSVFDDEGCKTYFSAGMMSVEREVRGAFVTFMTELKNFTQNPRKLTFGELAAFMEYLDKYSEILEHVPSATLLRFFRVVVQNHPEYSFKISNFVQNIKFEKLLKERSCREELALLMYSLTNDVLGKSIRSYDFFMMLLPKRFGDCKAVMDAVARKLLLFEEAGSLSRNDTGERKLLEYYEPFRDKSYDWVYEKDIYESST